MIRIANDSNKNLIKKAGDLKKLIEWLKPVIKFQYFTDVILSDEFRFYKIIGVNNINVEDILARNYGMFELNEFIKIIDSLDKEDNIVINTDGGDCYVTDIRLDIRNISSDCPGRICGKVVLE